MKNKYFRKKIVLLLLFCLSNCATYTSFDSGNNYSKIKPQYRSKKEQKIPLHYILSFRCKSGGSVMYCSDASIRDLIKDTFRKYNLVPVAAYQNDSSKPSLIIRESHSLEGFAETFASTFITIFSVGLVPVREKMKYHVSLVQESDKIIREEQVTTWTGYKWIMQMFTKNIEKPNENRVSALLLMDVLNQAIEDKKLKVFVEHVGE